MRKSCFSALDNASEPKLQLLLRVLQIRIVVLRRDGSTASDEYDGEHERAVPAGPDLCTVQADRVNRLLLAFLAKSK